MSARWNPRGEPTWPDWRRAIPLVTRVEHVRTGHWGTFVRWPATQIRGRNPGYAVIEWDPKPPMSRSHVGRVVAYAFDLRPITE
jgi:hypothetical protein